MFHVTEYVYGPDGKQLNSDFIADYASEKEANDHADRLTTAQEACPPNADEEYCRWTVIAD